jgi:hypothetical protein
LSWRPSCLSHPRPCLQIKADARAIRSSRFGCRYSVRFPRITRVRRDLGLGDVKTSAGLEKTIEEMAGRMAEAGENTAHKLFRK